MFSGKTIGIFSGYTENNRIEPVWGGRKYFERLYQMIDQAHESIHLQTYIFPDDETGK